MPALTEELRCRCASLISPDIGVCGTMPDCTAVTGIPGGNTLYLARHLFHRISGFAALCRIPQQVSGFPEEMRLLWRITHFTGYRSLRYYAGLHSRYRGSRRKCAFAGASLISPDIGVCGTMPDCTAVIGFYRRYRLKGLRLGPGTRAPQKGGGN